MKDNMSEKNLASIIALEQDSGKLIELVKEINSTEEADYAVRSE